MSNNSDFLAKINELIELFPNNSSNVKPIDTKHVFSSVSDNFRQNVIQLYNKQEFCDLEFKIGPNEDIIRANKLLLILNGCEAVKTFSGQTFAIKDVSKESFDSIMKCFHLEQIDLELSEEKMEDFIKILRSLGNEQNLGLFLDLKQKFDEKERNDCINESLKYFTSIQNKFKRKLDFENSFTDSEQNISNVSTNKWKPIGGSEERPSKKMRLDSDKEVETNKSQNTSMEHKKCSNGNQDKQSVRVSNISHSSVADSDTDNDLVIDFEEYKTSEKTNGLFDYKLEKFIDSHQIPDRKPLINVWNSCFVPKKVGSNDDVIVAVVGGHAVQYINCSKNYEICGLFEAPERKQLYSIAFTQMYANERLVYNVCAVGSQECIYLCKEPKESKVEFYAKLTGVEEVVNTITFSKDRPNYMFCGTFDNKIIVWELGAINLKDNVFRCGDTSIIYKFSAHFPIITILYVPKFDCLVASGESPDILIFDKISSLKPTVGKAIVARNMKANSGLTFDSTNNLIVIRSSNSEFIRTAQLDKMLEKLRQKRLSGNEKSKAILISFLPWSKLTYAKSDEFPEFIYMSENASIIGCGGHNGCLYLYDSTKMFRNKALEPKVLSCDHWPNCPEPPLIRSVSISDNKTYIVSTTNNNLTCIWKATGDSL